MQTTNTRNETPDQRQKRIERIQQQVRSGQYDEQAGADKAAAILIQGKPRPARKPKKP